MGKYVKEWEQLKTDFEAATNTKRPKRIGKDFFGNTVQKASGVTPVLKDIDTALEKEERTPLEKALNKLMEARSSYISIVQAEQKKFNPMDDGDLPMWTAYKDLYIGLQNIEDKAAQDAKALQAKKSGGGESITWLGIEGDLKGTIADAKKKLAAFAALEKKHSVLKKADAALKAAETYTKAAARTQAKEAREALELFKVEAAKAATELGKVMNAEKDDKFKTAVKSFHDAMQALSVVTRVDQQITNLKVMEAKAAG